MLRAGAGGARLGEEGSAGLWKPLSPRVATCEARSPRRRSQRVESRSHRLCLSSSPRCPLKGPGSRVWMYFFHFEGFCAVHTRPALAGTVSCVQRLQAGDSRRSHWGLRHYIGDYMTELVVFLACAKDLTPCLFAILQGLGPDCPTACGPDGGSRPISMPRSVFLFRGATPGRSRLHQGAKIPPSFRGKFQKVVGG